MQLLGDQNAQQLLPSAQPHLFRMFGSLNAVADFMCANDFE